MTEARTKALAARLRSIGEREAGGEEVADLHAAWKRDFKHLVDDVQAQVVDLQRLVELGQEYGVLEK